MRKRTSLFLIIIFITMMFSSCDTGLNKKKPISNYYTNLVKTQISQNNVFTCSILDINFYKEENVNKEDASYIKDFFKYINKENIIKKPKDLPPKPKYKIFLNINKEKYIIDVYNEKYISIYPWDGDYDRDYLNIDNIYLRYNLYSLSNYMLSKIKH